jgi:hypothetical protein
VCIADETNSTLLSVQGGESSINKSGDGFFEISVQDIIPNGTITIENQMSEIPIEILNNVNPPLNAALVLFEDDNESTSMIIITNLSFSNENNNLVLKVKPMAFYDGEILKEFVNNRTPINLLENSSFEKTKLYFELLEMKPENSKKFVITALS